ncbi:MAG TPA: dual specificity protein phosphatase family protein [Pyrinomonadaceae bacterium]|nr:dual specificity protein phosphatase family protein [Pyrinomonadaceae bacterium]
MSVNIHWIDKVGPGRIATMPRLAGGEWLEDDVRWLKESGVDVVVSLLESAEIAAFDLGWEKEACLAQGISFRSFPITDRSVPSSVRETLNFVHDLSDLLQGGHNVAIHCLAGIGRSTIIAACVLLLNGMSIDDALSRIERARGCRVPDTPEQREWISKFATCEIVNRES